VTKALFLDRDGVINIDKGYLYKIEDVEFCEAIFEVCQKYQRDGYIIVIVTNQSGIARGYYSQKQFDTLSEWMIDQFAQKGVQIAKIYHCPHLPTIDKECQCRKPKAGMLFKAAKELDISLEKSTLIGDNSSDIEAAKNAGLKEYYLISSQLDNSYNIRSLKELL